MTTTSEDHDSACHSAALELAASFHSQRQILALSQEEVAILAGITTVTYRAVERAQAPNGRLVNPRLSTIVRVMSVLEVHATVERGLPIS